MPPSIRNPGPGTRNQPLKTVWAVARVVISAAVLYWVFTRIPLDDVLAVFREASLPGLAFYAALSGLPHLLTAARWWRLVVDQGVPLPYLGAFRLTLVGLFFNNFLLGSTGGDVVKAAVAGAETGKTPRLLSTVLLDRLVGLIVVILIGAVGLLAYLPFATPAERDHLAVPGLFVSAALAGFLVLYLVYHSRALRESAPARWIAARLPLRNTLREMDEVLLYYREKRGLVAATIGITVVSQASLIAATWVAGRAIGITEASVLHYIVLIPLIELILAVPISVGGWGVGEAVYPFLFGLVGVDPGKAVALSLLYKMTVILYGLPGGICFAVGRRGGKSGHGGSEEGVFVGRGAVEGRNRL